MIREHLSVIFCCLKTQAILRQSSLSVNEVIIPQYAYCNLPHTLPSLEFPPDKAQSSSNFGREILQDQRWFLSRTWGCGTALFGGKGAELALLFDTVPLLWLSNRLTPVGTG
ncbi:hypothetical protein Q7267_12115, partial [Glaesserella parasuis]|nr:hypothetical protein [Glaesserella parasuis]